MVPSNTDKGIQTGYGCIVYPDNGWVANNRIYYPCQDVEETFKTSQELVDRGIPHVCIFRSHGMHLRRFCVRSQKMLDDLKAMDL